MKDGSDYVCTYRRNLAATELIFEILAGNNLSSWSPVSTTDQILSDDGSTQVIAARFPGNLLGNHASSG